MMKTDFLSGISC